MHFPASLHSVSPTAMGLISGGDPSLFLFKAISLPPARNADTEEGAFPIFTTALSEVLIDVCCGINQMLGRESRGTIIIYNYYYK